MMIRNRIKELRSVSATDLKPSARNWRTHPKAQQDALRGVLAEIGFADAVLARELADGSLELIDGHLRSEIVGDTEVPVLVLDVNEEEAGKLLATLDPLAAMAGADPAKLDELLKQISFDSDAVAAMLRDMAEAAGLAVASGTPVVDDQVPEPPSAEDAVSQRGDLWILNSASTPTSRRKDGKASGSTLVGVGGHRLLCGDATDPGDVRRVMDGKRATLFATDPPYLVGYDGTNHPQSFTGGGSRDWSASYGNTWDDADGNPDLYDKFVGAAIAEALTENAAWYCWHASRRQAMLESVWNKHGAFVHCQIVWGKNRPVLTRTWYMWQHEPCLMGWLKGKKPPKGPEAKPTSTLWMLDTIPNGDERPDHPTPKPLEVFAIPMRQHLPRGGICYEPFSGSGSQIIAAEQLERRCFAIEIEPRYVDVAVIRWQRLTGLQAVLAETGQTFEQVQKARRQKSAVQPRPVSSPAAVGSTGSSVPAARRSTKRPRAKAGA